MSDLRRVSVQTTVHPYVRYVAHIRCDRPADRDIVLTFNTSTKPVGTVRNAARAIVFEISSTTPVTLSFAAPADPTSRAIYGVALHAAADRRVAMARLWIISRHPTIPTA